MDSQAHPKAEADEKPEDTVFVDAATRVSKPSAFDDWYYSIEDQLGQGTVGMGVCFLLFMLVVVFATVFSPI